MVSENAVKNSLPIMEIQGNSMLLPINGHPMLGCFLASTSEQGQTVRKICYVFAVSKSQQKVNTPICERPDVNLTTFYLRPAFSIDLPSRLLLNGYRRYIRTRSAMPSLPKTPLSGNSVLVVPHGGQASLKV